MNSGINSRSKTNFLIQGSILAFASIICRLIGIAYRIPLVNIIGDEGSGYYSIAFDIYAIMLLISSYSLPLAVSKLVSRRAAEGKMKDAYRVFISAMFFALVVGTIVSAVTYFGAEIFASLTKFYASHYAIRTLAPALIIMSVLGVFRGYFQGLGTMIPTALSNIFEQIANAIVSIVAAKHLYDFGKMRMQEVNAHDYYPEAFGAAGGTLGTVVGAAVGLLFLIWIFFLYRRVLSRQIRRDHTVTLESYPSITKGLMITIIPVLLSTTVYNISGLIDGTIFGNIMRMKGMLANDYSSLYGMFGTKYRLLTNVPIAVAAALASSIIPSLSASVAEGDQETLKKKTGYAIRFMMIVAMPCAVGLFVLAEPLLMLLFPKSTHESVVISGNMLRMGAVSVILYGVSTITNAVLQGIDRMKVPVKNACISLAIHVVFVIVMMLVFDLSIYAVVLGDVLFALLVCILNANALKKFMGYQQELLKTFVLPGMAAVMMGIFTYASYQGIHMIIKSNAISTLLTVFAAIVIYAFLAILFKVIEDEELLNMPMGIKILKLFRRI